MEEVKGEGVHCGGGGCEKEEPNKVVGKLESDVQKSRGRDTKIKNTFTSKTIFTQPS